MKIGEFGLVTTMLPDYFAETSVDSGLGGGSVQAPSGGGDGNGARGYCSLSVATSGHTANAGTEIALPRVRKPNEVNHE